MMYFRYHNTNCYFIKSTISDKLLAIDAGWPNTLFEYARCLKQIEYKLDQIEWSVVTHFHMDHAGLISEFIDRGIKCYAFEHQVGYIDQMEKTILKNNKNYKLIDKSKLLIARIDQFTRVLQSIGITGEVIVTGSHSPDSISFITNKDAIIGDLSPQYIPNDEKHIKDWETLKAKGIEMIYPSHAMPFNINTIV